MTSVLPTPRVGPYRMIRPLGAGGMGEVFLAHDAKLGRDIALKVLPSSLANDASLLARLRQEARAASSLNHPNIVTIYEIGEMDDGAYIAMEHIEGKTLRELLASGALPVKKALQIVVQIADGLAAAHKRGLVHRDLKPENVMLTSDGVVKILDFGLAKQEQKEEEHPRASIAGIKSDRGTVVGTYGYMAPEQARGERVDYRADQFALGAMLYELVTAKRAFEGASGIETLFMIVRDEPVPLSTLVSNVPAPYRWIVERCLAKDPEERYVSTVDLARDLRQLRDHYNESSLSTPSAKPIEAIGGSRKKLVIPFVIGALLAIAATVAAFSLRKSEPPMLRSERYLTYSGLDFSPAVSPDGKLIAFSSLRDGRQRIWLKQVDGGGEVALTEGVDDFPRFSPDGSSVIFTRVEPNGASIFRVATVGGEPRRIVPNAGSGDFSPDGTRLAYSVNAPQLATPIGRIFVGAADGSGAKEVGKLDNNQLIQPRWSPDGKKIAAVALRARVAQGIAIIDVAGGSVKLLSFPPKSGEVSSAIWTKDSGAVIYLRSESVEAVVGSTAKIVRHDIKSDVAENIGWSSHNGNVLDVLANGRIVTDVRSPRDNMRAASVITDPAAPRNDKWITRGNSSDRQPAYSPDGKSLLFTSNRSGNLDLWIVDLASGGVRRVTDDASEDWDPGFTPDGRVVWSSGRSGNLEIWIANADGTDAKQISRDGFDAENPSATPDGWIVYNSFNEAKTGLWKVRYDGSQATRIVSGRTAVPDVSPDGKYVAYLVNPRTGTSEVRVARVSDGKDMGVGINVRGTRRTNAILGRVRWMPDSKAIAFLAQDAQGMNGVFAQDFVPGVDTTNTRRPLAGFDPDRSTESFGIAPDGKAVALAEWEQLFSLFAIDGIPGVARTQQPKS